MHQSPRARALTTGPATSGRVAAALALVVTLVAALLAGAVGAAGPADAITDGTADGDEHPYVGLVTLFDADGVYQGRCSGTLLSPTLLLTAGHCTDGVARAEIFFDPGPIPVGTGFDTETWTCADDATGYPCEGDAGGAAHTHPDYDPNAFWLHDLGVVVLDEPVRLDQYGVLPQLGQFDGLKRKDDPWFTAVGYGLQQAYPPAASWKDQAVRERRQATVRLIQADKGYVGDYSWIMTNNAKTGGSCFGDSGGPYFWRDTNVVAGVTSFGKNWTCGGQGGVYRVDTADDLDWLSDEFGHHLRTAKQGKGKRR